MYIYIYIYVHFSTVLGPHLQPCQLMDFQTLHPLHLQGLLHSSIRGRARLRGKNCGSAMKAMAHVVPYLQFPEGLGEYVGIEKWMLPRMGVAQ